MKNATEKEALKEQFYQEQDPKRKIDLARVLHEKCFAEPLTNEDGSRRSGNYGHRGRRGLHGGSAKSHRKKVKPKR